MEQKNVLFIGGDKRMSYAAERMFESGYFVKGFSLFPIRNYGYNECDEESIPAEISKADTVVLPIPCSPEYKLNDSVLITFSDCIDKILPGTSVYGGLISSDIKHMLNDKSVHVFDYYKWERVSAANSVPTAQGVLKTILSLTEKTLDNVKVIVTGYGKSGSAICSILNSLHVNVVAVARSRKSREMANAAGITCKSFDLLADEVHDADFIINTVPALVITSKVIANLPDEACIIDIASAPYGTDFDAAKERGIFAVAAGGLPGKTAPQTAGIILADAIISHMRGEKIE